MARRRLVAAASALALATGGAVAAASVAHAETLDTEYQGPVVQSIDDPHSPDGVPNGPVGRAYLLSSSAGIFSSGHPGAQPAGVNDFSCKPAEGTHPVILVPGTTADAFTSFSSMAPFLKSAGLCLYTFNTNPSTNSLNEQASFSGDIRASAQVMARFVDRVLESTGSDKVDVVGHSQGGGALPRAYIKWYGGSDKVNQLVGIAPNNNGTTVGGLSVLINRPGSLSGAILDSIAKDHNSMALPQQIVGSGFFKALNEGGRTVPGIKYTTIASSLDATLTPYQQAQFIDEPGVTNLTLQKTCPFHLTSHPQMTYDKAVQQMTLNALDPDHAKSITC